MRNYHWLLALVTLLLLAACSNTLTPPSLESLGEDSPVLFQASVWGGLAQTGPKTFELTGDATADINNTGYDDINYEADVRITKGNPGDPVIKDVLTETLTFENGDTLTIRCFQVATLSEDGTSYHGEDNWTVIGGTGQFSDAAGSGSGHTDVDLVSGTFTKWLTGTISYEADQGDDEQ